VVVAVIATSTSVVVGIDIYIAVYVDVVIDVYVARTTAYLSTYIFPPRGWTENAAQLLDN
jgi:hypothetical protein